MEFLEKEEVNVKFLFIYCILFSSTFIFSQKISGKVTYKITMEPF